MAITDVKQYAHLSAEDVEALGRELDAIRADIGSPAANATPATSAAPSSCNAPWWSALGSC
jgi:hypothetical protein